MEEYLLQDETQAVHLRRVVRDRAAIFVFAQVRHHLLQQRRQIRPVYTRTARAAGCNTSAQPALAGVHRITQVCGVQGGGTREVQRGGHD